MKTTPASQTYLPFGLGEPRSFGSLTLVPLYAEADPRANYVGLDEAIAGGLTVTEATEAGLVETLLVANPLGTAVLLYEGEELVGAKQNRILERSILVAPGAKLEIPVRCVEQGRWAYRTSAFAAAPRAAYPEALRDVLEHRPPRTRLDVPPVEAARTVDSSYLFVQGPPGSGKTWTGARMAIALMKQGQRVGVTSRSHKAIQKFLEDVRRSYVDLLGPLVETTAEDVDAGLRLFERNERLGAFDAVLAAVALRLEVEALISGDGAFAPVAKLPFVPLDSAELDRLLA